MRTGDRGASMRAGPGLAAEVAAGLALALAALAALLALARPAPALEDAPRAPGGPGTGEEVAPRFRAADLHLESSAPIAAYQVEIAEPGGRAVVAGLEGGEHPAFREPPYYDPEALHRSHRVAVAAFSTAADLPRGRTRVATLHFMVEGRGEPELNVSLQAAAGRDGEKISARAQVSWRERGEH